MRKCESEAYLMWRKGYKFEGEECEVDATCLKSQKVGPNSKRHLQVWGIFGRSSHKLSIYELPDATTRLHGVPPPESLVRIRESRGLESFSLNAPCTLISDGAVCYKQVCKGMGGARLQYYRCSTLICWGSTRPLPTSTQDPHQPRGAQTAQPPPTTPTNATSAAWLQPQQA